MKFWKWLSISPACRFVTPLFLSDFEETEKGVVGMFGRIIVSLLLLLEVIFLYSAMRISHEEAVKEMNEQEFYWKSFEQNENNGVMKK